MLNTSGNASGTCWECPFCAAAERRAQRRYVTFIPEVPDRWTLLQLLNMSMLPPAAGFCLPWEVNSMKEGESVRTFGRLGLKVILTERLITCPGSECTWVGCRVNFQYSIVFILLLTLDSWLCRLVCYQPDASRATLTAQHASKEHHVFVHTQFVEPFNPIIGAQYLVLGETENHEGKRSHCKFSLTCHLLYSNIQSRPKG